MREFLTTRVRRLSAGWLWLVVLLVLPNCSFHGPPPPGYTAVYCDVQQPPLFGRHCASAAEQSRGIRLAAAAVALNRGDTTDVGLDDSPAARARCGGEPEAVLFRGAFPEGQPACVSEFTNPLSACAVPCQQYFGDVADDGTFVPQDPPDPSVVQFCGQQAFAHLSANVPRTSGVPLGYPTGCTEAGMLIPEFVDPRRKPERIEWDLAGQVGVASYDSIVGGVLTHNLMRVAATSAPATDPPFDAGAASSQWITKGDAYVEFSAFENTLSHVLGLSEINVGPLGCPFESCDDHDPSLDDIGFAISLNRDGRFYVIENGVLVNGPDVNGSFGTYNAGDKFRVKVTDNSDLAKTATISYVRIVGSCSPGTPCPELVFYASLTHVGNYPLRADTSFREYGAKITDVRIVRIQ